MNILGISGSTHDSSASVICDGELICVIEEERVSRIKHASNILPINAAKEAIRCAGISIDNIDLISYFIDPNKFNSGVIKHILFDDWKRYLMQPVDYNTSRFIFRGKRYKNDLTRLMNELGLDVPIEFVDHHLAHAASAFYLSGFNEAMIMTLDNMGEFDSTLLAKGTGCEIEPLARQMVPHSLGMFYGAVTDYLGFRAWDEEGKVMALAAYGRPSIPLEEMIELGGGTFKVKESFQMIQTKKKDRLFSESLVRKFGPPRKRGEAIEKRHQDVAASVQYALEETAKYLAVWLHKKTGMRNLCLAGGVALNCKMNGELARLPFIDNIYVTPIAGDAGAGLGAAVFSSVNHNGHRPRPLLTADIGRGFNDKDILLALDQSGVSYSHIQNPAEEAINKLLDEKVISFYQGRSEIGPRALGNRSILALPQESTTRDYINSQVKHRELWRPLCPSVLQDQSDVYFDNSSGYSFMNISSHASDFAKKRIPAVIHVDGSVRVQSVSKGTSSTYYDLLNLTGRAIGDPVLLNTSFNSRGEPIVDSPTDAIRCFMRMPINSMIIGDYLVSKRK